MNARSVIESLGITYHRPTKPRWTVRLFGYALLSDLHQLFAGHDVQAPIRSASGLDNGAKLDLLQSHIDRGNPVVIAIGNGHLNRDRYVPAARLLLGHYLTIYGYEKATETFFVYDSYLEGDPDGPLPAGNETRTYQEMLRDWRGPFYYPAIRRDHVYMPAYTSPSDTEANR